MGQLTIGFEIQYMYKNASVFHTLEISTQVTKILESIFSDMTEQFETFSRTVWYFRCQY